MVQPSDLFRRKEAVAAIVLVTSAVGIYSLFHLGILQTGWTEPAPGLHRRGAVRRRGNTATQIPRVSERDDSSPGRHVQTGISEALERIQAIDGGETLADDESALSFAESENEEEKTDKSLQLLDLLYRIGEENARRNYYIHRAIECSSCGTCPIQGIRYRCSNCADYELCETCESQQVHVKHHVFYKIRIPAPRRGRIKHVKPTWYSGNPRLFHRYSLPRHVAKSLKQKTEMDKPEMDALLDQFTCIASHKWPEDPAELEVAIDRRDFDKMFVPPESPPNLIYDRIFAFYDTNADGLIGFEEFLMGVHTMQLGSKRSRLDRIFKCYDIDGDGFVSRKDFLRIFRAYYALTKELCQEMILNPDDESADEDPRAVIESSAPLSTAFPGGQLNSRFSRTGVGKAVDSNGDMVIMDGHSILQEDLPVYGDRHLTIADAAAPASQQPGVTPRSSAVGRDRTPSPELRASPPPSDDDVPPEREDSMRQIPRWPPFTPVTSDDILVALGRNIPIDDITDSEDRQKVLDAQAARFDGLTDSLQQAARSHAIAERWRRRQFYTDVEEGMPAPPGYTENDSSDDDDRKAEIQQPMSEKSLTSRRQSMRSRSSSKVRFEDDVADHDCETRSNTSSRSAPVGERWGGLEISEAEKDVGKEILFQAVQQGFNELLDPLFKEKEDQAMEAQATKALRLKWASQLQEYEESKEADAERLGKALRDADALRTEELIGSRYAVSPSESLTNKVHEDLQEPAPDQDGPDGGRSDGDEADLMANGTATDGMASPNATVEVRRSSDHSEKPQAEEVGEAVPNEEQLRLWSEHKRIDAEAGRRGGYGRLDFDEFAVQMVEEDAVAETAGINPEDRDPERIYSRSSKIGKLEFVGSWLEELGSF